MAQPSDSTVWEAFDRFEREWSRWRITGSGDQWVAVNDRIPSALPPLSYGEHPVARNYEVHHFKSKLEAANYIRERALAGFPEGALQRYQDEVAKWEVRGNMTCRDNDPTTLFTGRLETVYRYITWQGVKAAIRTE